MSELSQSGAVPVGALITREVLPPPAAWIELSEIESGDNSGELEDFRMWRPADDRLAVISGEGERFRLYDLATFVKALSKAVNVPLEIPGFGEGNELDVSDAQIPDDQMVQTGTTHGYDRFFRLKGGFADVTVRLACGDYHRLNQAKASALIHSVAMLPVCSSCPGTYGGRDGAA